MRTDLFVCLNYLVTYFIMNYTNFFRLNFLDWEYSVL